MVSVKTEAGKTLIYQSVILINSRAITLTIISIITLIEDQEQKLRQKSVSILALTAAKVKANFTILEMTRTRRVVSYFCISKNCFYTIVSLLKLHY